MAMLPNSYPLWQYPIYKMSVNKIVMLDSKSKDYIKDHLIMIDDIHCWSPKYIPMFLLI